MNLNKTIKKMKWYDASLVKLSAAAGIIFLLKLIPAFMSWVERTSIWVFLILMLIFMTRPLYLFFKK
jgi:hypothetical protein